MTCPLRLVSRLCMGAFLLLLGVTAALAQSTFGTIRGTATDATGAVIPEVTVVVRNTGTNIENKATTNLSGLYEVTHLIPGNYSVTAEHPGFKSVVVSNLQLQTSATVRADLQLELGDITTSISVEATTPVINTEGAEVAGVRDFEQMVRLPINNRGSVGGGFYYDMLIFTPGAQRGQGSNFSFAGARGFQWGTSVDGITQTSPLFDNSVGPAQSNMEITSELRIQLSNDKAESATPGGFYATSKSGTNQLHGSVFYYWGGSELNARNPFSTSVPKAGKKSYGGSLGGAIVADRTFYFVTVEKDPETNQRIFNSDLPTTAFRGGNFSSLLPNTVVTDPSTGSPFPGNIIPSSRLNASSLSIQDRFYPTPNTGGADSFIGNWRGVGEGSLYKDVVEGRIDHRFSDSNSIFTRVSWNRGGAEVFDYNLITMPVRSQDRRSTTLTVSDTHIFSTSVINEFRFGFMRSENPAFNALDGRALVQEFGLQGLNLTDIGEGAPVFSFNNFETIGASDIFQNPSEAITQAVNNVTWTRQDHTIKTGVELKWNRGTNFPGGTSFPVRQFGDFRFTGTFSGFDYADFLLGIPQRAQRGNPAPLINMVNTDVSFFVQDDWKVTRKLTLNLGVRYDFNPPYHERDDQFFNFDPSTGQMIVPNESALSRVSPLFPTDLAPVVTAAQAGVPESLWNSDKNNFTPRFGFAYRPFATGNTVLRGGYGVYIDHMTSSLWRLGTGGPFVSFETFNNSISNGIPEFQFPNAFPGGFGAIGAQSFDAIDPDFRNPYIQQWNFTLEQEVWDMGLRLSYIGTVSRKLSWTQDINQPFPGDESFSNGLRLFPGVNRIQLRQSGAVHNYHSLHAVAERRMKSGLYYQLGWTWAKNLTNAQSDSTGGSRPQDSWARHLEYGNVSYTNRHRAVGSLLWELPVGRGRQLGTGMSRGVDWIIGGWTVSSTLQASTGEFFSPSYDGFDVSNTNEFSGRPDRIGDGNYASSQRNINDWFDRSAFVVPGDLDGDNRPDVNVGRFGNSAPNVLEGPGLLSLGFGLHKYFAISERARVVIQSTFTNAPNHPGYANPTSNIRSSSAGLVRGTSRFGGPRSGQLAVRFEF